MIDAKTNSVAGQIDIRIPGLEKLRGVLPIGMAYHEATGWLLVAEAGINAVGVIDTRQCRKELLGHLPAAWFPSRVVIDGDTVFVTNANGQGTGPNVWQSAFSSGAAGELFHRPFRRGGISVFPLPAAADVAAGTQTVMDNNGLNPRDDARPGRRRLPSGVKYVVMIVKENRTYDEVFGDIQRLASGADGDGRAGASRASGSRGMRRAKAAASACST